jgi:hypothetical protein
VLGYFVSGMIQAFFIAILDGGKGLFFSQQSAKRVITSLKVKPSITGCYIHSVGFHSRAC